MENEVLDIIDALSRVDGDKELLRELAGLFLENYPAQLAGILSAIARNNNNALECAAHDIRGSVGVFCAKSVFGAALKLEIMAKENNLVNVKDAYIALENEIGRLKQQLEIMVKEKS